jgi:hypothetical protein
MIAIIWIISVIPVEKATVVVIVVDTAETVIERAVVRAVIVRAVIVVVENIVV